MTHAVRAAAALCLLAALGCGSKTTRPIEDKSTCVSGFVLIDGQPGAGALVVASSGSSTLAGSTGEYTLRLPPDSTITLRVRASEADSFFFADSLTLRSGPAKSPCARQDFHFGGAAAGLVCVRGRVSLDFAPVEGALVVAGAGRYATTDARGGYLFRISPGETVTLRAEARVGGALHHATLNFMAPATPGVVCAAPELSLAPDAVPYHVEVLLESHPLEGAGFASSARCRIWNEASGLPVSGALLTILPQEGVPVPFTAGDLPGEYIAAGDLTPGDPPQPTADPGYRYHLSVDVDHDGLEDAAADVDGPPISSIADPPSNAVRPGVFFVYWRGRPRPDSAAYTVRLRDGRTGLEFTSEPRIGDRFTRFEHIPPGAYTLELRGTRGGGQTRAHANLSSAKVFGHLWSDYSAPAVPMTVVGGGVQ